MHSKVFSLWGRGEGTHAPECLVEMSNGKKAIAEATWQSQQQKCSHFAA